MDGKERQKDAYPDPMAKIQPTDIFCFVVKWRSWIVGIGTATTAKSDAMFRTAWARATFSRHLVVPDLRGLHGPPVILVRAKV
jgi:hypothetical protein